MNAPKRIYLQGHDNPDDDFVWTWATDREEDDDVEYVRADVMCDEAAKMVDAAAVRRRGPGKFGGHFYTVRDWLRHGEGD